MRAAAIGAVLLAALAAQTASAMAAEYETCMNAAGAIDPKMFACQDRELGQQDRALNAVYATLIARLKTNPGTTTRLKAAERAWITFRDADCAVLDMGAADGSMDRMVLNDCIIDATKRRVVELKSLETQVTTDAR